MEKSPDFLSNLVGRVLGVNAIIGFHSETLAEFRADFEATIDFMLEDCRARGIAPEKPLAVNCYCGFLQNFMPLC